MIFHFVLSLLVFLGGCAALVFAFWPTLRYGEFRSLALFVGMLWFIIGGAGMISR